MIDEAKIQEIIDKTDMVGLVSEFVTLNKRGKNYFGLCPFHDDNSPSFSVSPDKKIAKCMSCGEGGNPINFLRKIKNVSFEEAVEELAKRANVTLNLTKETKKNDSHQKYYEINEVATKFYQHFLFNSQTGKEALAYLYKRGLSLETIKMFRIGLAPKDHNVLYKLLSDQGYHDIDMEDVGLIKINNSDCYDLFSNRIMFPIIDDNNHVLGFSGRIYYQSEDEPRYINTKETVIYHKGDMLYNLNNAIPSIRKKGRVILCEGQMDVIAVTNAGIGEAVCSLGTALTPEQSRLLAKYAKKVIISYDGDAAGIKATKKAFEILRNFETTSIVLPKGMDPDEYISQNGSQAFEDFIRNNQKDYYEFLYFNAFLNRDLSVVHDYESVKKEVFSFLKASGSKALIEKMLKRLSIDLKISFEAIFNDYNLYSNRSAIVKDVENPQEVKNISNNILPHEKMFLSLIIYDEKYYDYYLRELDNEVDEYLSTRLALKVYMAVSHFYNLHGEKGKLLNYCYQETKDNIVYEIMDNITQLANYDEKKIAKIASDTVERFKKIKYRNRLSEFEINTTEVTPEVVEVLDSKLEFVRNSSKNRESRGKKNEF